MPTPNPSPEMGHYHRPELPAAPEKPVSNTPEQQPHAETHEGGTQAAQSGPALPAPQAPSAPQAASPVTQQSTTDNTPLSAADDEVIEKEWVEKAKDIVNQTKSDPYAQEKEVSKLQADYIKKRYGKEIKLVSD